MGLCDRESHPIMHHSATGGQFTTVAILAGEMTGSFGKTRPNPSRHRFTQLQAGRYPNWTTVRMHTCTTVVLYLCTYWSWVMPVVAIINQKGGTGKTTLSTNLAWAFAESSSVLLLDADPQGSAQDWADSQAKPLLSLAVKAVEPGRLMQNMRSLTSAYDWVIIDGPPGITKISADAVRAADLVLIPARPAPSMFGRPLTSWRRCRPGRRPPKECPKRPSSSP